MLKEFKVGDPQKMRDGTEKRGRNEAGAFIREHGISCAHKASYLPEAARCDMHNDLSKRFMKCTEDRSSLCRNYGPPAQNCFAGHPTFGFDLLSFEHQFLPNLAAAGVALACVRVLCAVFQ